MTDMYQKLANSPLGGSLVDALNLPRPVFLERLTRNDAPLIEGHVALGGLTAESPAIGVMRDVLQSAPAHAHAHETVLPPFPGAGQLDDASQEIRFKALVFDATNMCTLDQLAEVYRFFHQTVRRLATCGRIVVLGSIPNPADAEGYAAHQALEGFVKSVGKEIGRKGATANLIRIKPGMEAGATSTLQFFLSPRSAYVDGQVVRIEGRPRKTQTWDPTQPLAGKTALVTGASRGIGEAICRTLARDGARVFALDIPATESALRVLRDQTGAEPVLLDISTSDAPAELTALAEEVHGLDIIVHNAGITRDKTLANMPEHLWEQVLNINIQSIVRINSALLDRGLVRPEGRLLGLASISGIAGNFGQSNYAASKAAVIGYTEALGKTLKQGITANAVAPGFIETQMTAAIPFAIREAGRRMNALSQGGQPQDVAETLAWLASPGSQGVNGQTIRVCGLNLIGR